MKVCIAASEQAEQNRKNRNSQVLSTGKSDTFWDMNERQQFYLWFYEQRQDHIRWPLAAAIVAYQAGLGASSQTAVGLGVSSDEIQALLRRANQVIFDDVLPKLRSLSESSQQLKDQAAIDWDAGLLSEEQNLIQDLYKDLSPKDIARLRDLAAERGVFVTIGSALTNRVVKDVLSGPRSRALAPKPFTGDLLSVNKRWRYGMELAASASKLVVEGSIPAAMPAPRDEYLNGTALAKIDTRVHLHHFEALADTRIDPPETPTPKLDQVILAFLIEEQKVFLSLPRFGKIAAAAGYLWIRMFRAVVTFRVNLLMQLEFLDTYHVSRWNGVDYAAIRPMIQAAPQMQRNLIRGGRWRDVFALICNKTSIVTAVNDLGVEEPERTEWINAA